MKRITNRLLVAAALLSLMASAAANPPTRVDQDTSVDVSGDSSRALGIGGADYDIGECMYHVGGFTVAVARRNPFCEGMAMVRGGMVDAGILHLCTQSKIGDNYESIDDCKAGLQPIAEPMAEPAPIIEDEDEHDEYEQRFAELEQQLAEAQKPRPIRREVVQQPWLDDAQRQALAEVVKK